MPATPSPGRPPRIVLYVDDSEHWHATAELVGAFARATGAHVTVTSSLLLPGSRQRAMDQATRLLDVPSEQRDTIGRAGIVEHTLPDVARETRADAVVVGRLGSVDRLTNGLIAHLIARRTPASVLIARGRPRAVRRILACTQGRASGMRPVRAGLAIARAFGAQLDVLHVVSHMGITDRGRERIEEDLRDFLHSDAPEAAHLRAIEAELGPVRGRVRVRAGLVVEEILEALREGGHDLLVIGAHEVEQPGSHLYEDFASLLLRASPASTLVVRQKTAI